MLSLVPGFHFLVQHCLWASMLLCVGPSWACSAPAEGQDWGLHLLACSTWAIGCNHGRTWDSSQPGKYAVRDGAELYAAAFCWKPATSFCRLGFTQPVIGGVDPSPDLPQQQVTSEEWASWQMQCHVGSWWPCEKYRVGGAVAGSRSSVGRVLGWPDRVRQGELAASGNAVQRKQPGWEQMVPQTAGAGASSRHMLRAALRLALLPPHGPRGGVAVCLSGSCFCCLHRAGFTSWRQILFGLYDSSIFPWQRPRAQSHQEKNSPEA